MKKLLLFLLLPVLSYGQVQIGEDIDGVNFQDFIGRDVSISDNGQIVAVGTPFSDVAEPDAGEVKIYEFINEEWIQKGNSILGESQNNAAGWSFQVSGNGEFVAVGSPGAEGNSFSEGQVRVFNYQNGEWIQVGQRILGLNMGDNCGTGVSISNNGNIVAIGCGGSGSNGFLSGEVRIFEFINEVWVQIGDQISGEDSLDQSGGSIKLNSDGSIIVIGDAINSSNAENSGQVRIFQNINNSWTQLGEDINGINQGDLFGGEINISNNGNFIIISAIRSDINGSDSGSVSVFENINEVWNQVGQTIAGIEANSLLGTGLDITSNGLKIAIGSANESSFGSVRFFELLSGNWTQVGNTIFGLNENDFFGISLSMNSIGDTIAIGADGYDINEMDEGQVKIYDISNLLSTQETTLINFTLYPNPTKNNLTISLSESDTLQKATIYNSLGQEVLQSTQTNIDVSSLSKGVYVVEVQTSTGKASEKLIIQ